MPIPIGLIMMLVVMLIMLMIGTSVLSSLDEVVQCPTGEGSTACQQTKSSAWGVIGIIPVVLMALIIFPILRMLGDEDDPFSTFRFRRRSTNSNNQTQNISLFMRIMLYLRLAKIKDNP